jgi:hypothetical protein
MKFNSPSLSIRQPSGPAFDKDRRASLVAPVDPEWRLNQRFQLPLKGCSSLLFSGKRTGKSLIFIQAPFLAPNADLSSHQFRKLYGREI